MYSYTVSATQVQYIPGSAVTVCALISLQGGYILGVGGREAGVPIY